MPRADEDSGNSANMPRAGEDSGSNDANLGEIDCACSSDLGLGGRHVEQRIKQLGLRHAVKVSHGELLLMGGWFQRELLHRTIPAIEWPATWAGAAASCARPPSDTLFRVNLTGHFVRKHSHVCALAPAFRAGVGDDVH